MPDARAVTDPGAGGATVTIKGVKIGTVLTVAAVLGAGGLGLGGGWTLSRDGAAAPTAMADGKAAAAEARAAVAEAKATAADTKADAAVVAVTALKDVVVTKSDLGEFKTEVREGLREVRGDLRVLLRARRVP